MSEKLSENAALVQALHDDGFVALEGKPHMLTSEEVKRVHDAVLKRYEKYLAIAHERQVDLTVDANSEKIPGFYVRKGGRIDMQLRNTNGTAGYHQPSIATASATSVDVEPVDMGELLQSLEAHWKPVVDGIFQPSPPLPLGDSTEPDDAHPETHYYLEYIGCVVARPGDSDQNWHLDGIHRDPTQHEPADRINVFVPLVDVTADVGGTEMKKRSHFHDHGRRGTCFDGYADLESVTHHVRAGTPILMDYRAWHRGLANKSSSVVRPLLYFKYARRHHTTTSSKRATSPSDDDTSSGDTSKAKKKKKRISLTTI